MTDRRSLVHRWHRWTLAGVLVVGMMLILMGGQGQRRPQLQKSLPSAVPGQIDGWRGSDVTLSDEEARIAGFTDYVFRVYTPSDSAGAAARPAAGGDAGFSVYAGYYAHQTQGRTIHSPKNCLPGGGWEPLASGTESVAVGEGSVVVNRYLLQNGDDRALVLYWYQGRGRVEENEYLVKLDLVKDAIFRRRTDEALVRIVVPIVSSEAEALERATSVASELVPALYTALPS